MCAGANAAFDLEADAAFSLAGDLVLALPFALIALYAVAGLLRGRVLRLAWFVQALLTILAWHEAAGSSSSSAALLFVVPLLAGPAIATLLTVMSSGWRAVRSWREKELSY